MRRVRAPFLPVLLLLIALVAAVPIVTNNPSIREELFLMFMLVTLASSINIIMGYTGYVSFGHIVFFGIGGYIAFWLMQTFGTHFLVAAVAGAVPAALIAVLIGIPILRLRGAYFALATIGINEAMKAFVTNFEPFGPMSPTMVPSSASNEVASTATRPPKRTVTSRTDRIIECTPAGPGSGSAASRRGRP